MTAAEIDRSKVRVLVVGDAGVGKTSLVHLMCHQEPILNPYWTIGCSVDVKIHDYKVGTPSERTYLLEIWDIGGWNSHKNSRSVFYQPVHGIILVHDLTNRKSHQNLRKWLAEILNKDGKERHKIEDYDPEQFAGSHIPILVIGTKMDQVTQTSSSSTGSPGLRDSYLHRNNSSIAEECGADEINLDCTQVKHLAPGTNNAVKVTRFFDKVIERRTFYARDNSMSPHPADRRRPPSYYSKPLHSD